MNRRRLLLATLLSAATAGVVGCGGSDGPTIAGSDASAAVAKAAGVRLTEVQVPDEVRDEGMETSFSNTATAASDKQVIFVFALDDASKVDDAADELKSSVAAGETVELFTRGNVVVVYGAAGKDRAKAVQAAVEAL